MIHIAICEDEKILRQHYIKYLDEYFGEKGERYCIDEYEKGSYLIKSDHQIYDFILLDVELGESIDGIQAAKELREQKNKAEIVFLTSYKQEAHRAFEVEAYRYVIKPIEKISFYKVLDEILRRIKAKSIKKYICLENKNGILRLYLDEILYIETIGRKQHMHTLTDTYEINYTMKELESALSEYGFFRIHTSFLIHMKYIKYHTKDTVTMENEDKLCLSRLRVKLFKEAFLTYIRGMEWRA